MSKTETNASVISRISECWGFQKKRIKLLEMGYHDGWCDHVVFEVAGVGYATNFRTIVMDAEFTSTDE